MRSLDTKNLFPGIPGYAKVWIYQANREFTADDLQVLEQELKEFVNDWKAHGSDLKADYEILLNRFVLLAVDERQAEASGCSIDSSVRKIREIGTKLNIDFFDRSNIAFSENDHISMISFRDLKDKFDQKIISADTKIFNNTIQSVAELHEKWLVSLKDSPAWQLVS